MRKQVHRWFSPHLGAEMPLAVYGHYGKPLLMFPTAAADFEEYERFLVIDVLRPYLDAGIVKIYSINSINRESWMNEHIHPAQRAARQMAYSNYISHEVCPFIRSDCGGSPVKIAATGASFGAYHAANSVFRNPGSFDTLIAMSGSYDIRPWCDGFHNDDVYFNNPIEYLQHLNDDYFLPLLRHQTDIHIVSGQGAYEAPERSRDLSRVLYSRGIPHSLDLWGHDVNHDWPWWRRMLDLYVPRLFHAYGPR